MHTRGNYIPYLKIARYKNPGGREGETAQTSKSKTFVVREKMKMSHMSAYTASHWLNGSPSFPANSCPKLEEW
jgi:hypothetical protein